MGTSGSSMRPSAWSIRRSSSAGKRAANGARGLSSSVPMVLKPSRRNVRQVSGESRSASTGSGASACASWPEGRTGEGARAKRASAQAMPGVSATAKPCRQAEIPFQPQRKIGQQSLLAAEEMRGAFDVEEKTVGAVFFAPKILAPRRSGRRIARRPEREAAQRGVIGGGIDRAGLHAGRLSRAHRPAARRA